MLLFLFLERASGACRPSALVAILFALHPLHVESVAWVVERKDVLCALFWFLGLWAYVRYVERPGPRRYLLVLLSFCLGLMAKPMIVTFPVVLLLLDIWPLRRRPAGILKEKIPFFVLSAASAIGTYYVQQAGGAVQAFVRVPLGLRVENALVTAIVYIVKMFWPSGLAVFYPYPAGYPAWEIGAAAVALGAISALAARWFRERPYLAAGWLWYLVTLAPVIGLVQVGEQARADRYTYVPMVGLTIMMAWGAFDLARRRPRAVPVLDAAAVVVCLGCASLTWAQVQHWENSETLSRQAIAVAGDHNYVAHHNLALALSDDPERLPEAIAEFRAALAITPNSPEAHNNLGRALANVPEGLPEAVAEFQTALRIDPASPESHNNLALALERLPGQLPEAIAESRAALRLKPDYAEAHNTLGLALAESPGRLPEAIAEFRAALRLKPDFVEAHNNLGLAFVKTPGKLTEAVSQFQTALRINPDSRELHDNLGLALADSPGRLPDAIEEFQAALRIDPDSPVSHNNLGMALARSPGRLPDAIAEFQAALDVDPNYADAHYNLGIALAQIPGRRPEAIKELEAGQRINPDPELRGMLHRLRAARR